MMILSKVYIILLNYNGWKDTIECLESVLKSDYHNYQIIVVDNYSADHSMEHIIRWTEGKQGVLYDSNSMLQYLSQPNEAKPLDYVFYTKDEALNGGDREKEEKYRNPLIFIRAGKNRGFAAGNNIGIQYALIKDDFEYVWLLNNDTVIKKETLSTLVQCAKDTHAGISGSTLMYYDEPEKVQAYGGTINKFFGVGRHLIEKKEIKGKLDYIVGASFLIDKRVLNKIGLFPEEYFLYYEEVDYCFKARNNGFNFCVCLESMVYHKEGVSTGVTSKKGKSSEFSDLLILKNRKTFSAKYLNNKFGLSLGLLIACLNRMKRLQFSRAWKVFKLMW